MSKNVMTVVQAEGRVLDDGTLEVRTATHLARGEYEAIIVISSPRQPPNVTLAASDSPSEER